MFIPTNVINFDESEITIVRLTAEEIIHLRLENKQMDKNMSADEPKRKKKPSDYEYFKKSITIGRNHDGSAKRKVIYALTEEELHVKVDAHKREYTAKLNCGGKTVRIWGPHWIETYKKQLPKATWRGYERRLEKDIYPIIGDILLSDLRASDCQMVLNPMAGKNKGLVEDTSSTLRQMLSKAVTENLITHNPAADLEMPPDLEEGEREPLNEVERIAFLKAAEKHKYGPFMLIMYYTGLRSGECAALRRSSVDLEKQTIFVDKAVFTDDYGKPKLGRTKAAKLRKNKTKTVGVPFGSREVILPNILLPIMIEVCKNKENDDMLFLNKNGTLLSSNNRRNRWEQFAKQCHIESGATVGKWKRINYETSSFGLDISQHCLRHSYATDINTAGLSDRAQKEAMGHALTKDISDRYRKMSDIAFKHAAFLLNYFYDNFIPYGYVDPATTVHREKPIQSTPIINATYKTISVNINPLQHKKLTCIAITQENSMDRLLTDIMKEYLALHELNPVVTIVDVDPLDDSPVPVVISVDSNLIGQMNEIAKSRNLTIVDTLSCAIKLFANKIESTSELIWY